MRTTYEFYHPQLKDKDASTLKEFHLTDLAKKLFEASPPGQGFVGFVNLITGEIHICPIYNLNDGKLRLPIMVEGKNYAFESPLELLSRPQIRGGGIAHETAAQLLNENNGVKLNEKEQLNCILGFGLEKGKDDSVLESFRNRSASRNLSCYKYNEDYVRLNATGDKYRRTTLERSIPDDVTEKIIETLCKELPVANEKQQRVLKNRKFMTKLRYSSEEFKKILPLHDAALQGDVEAINALLEKAAEASIDITDSVGRTPLMLAALSGNAEAVEALLKAGASVSAKDNEGLTPLMFAAVAGNVEAVEALLKAGASVNATDKNGWTPLMLATLAGKLEVIEALLQDDELVRMLHNEQESKINEWLPWGIAAKNGYVDIFRMLDEKLVLVNKNNYSEYLNLAITDRQPEILNYLMEKSTLLKDLLIQDLSTFLETTRGCWHPKVIQVFVEKLVGALILEVGKYPDTKDDHLKGVNIDMVETLIKAIENNDFPTAKFLLNYFDRADFPSFKLNIDDAGYLFVQAVANGDTEMAALLMDKFKIDITDLKNEAGQTPLQIAARLGNETLVKFLIGKGARLDNLNPNLLCLAIQAHNLDLVKFFLPQHQGSENLLEIAATSGSRKIFDYLRQQNISFGSDKNSLQAIAQAAFLNGWKDVAEEILKNNPHLKLDSEILGEALVNAINHGDKKMIDLLVEQHAAPFNALLVAIKKGDCELVSKLINEGAKAKVNMKFVHDNKPCTPLRLAMQLAENGQGKIDMVETLLKHQATVESKDMEKVMNYKNIELKNLIIKHSPQSQNPVAKTQNPVAKTVPSTSTPATYRK